MKKILIPVDGSIYSDKAVEKGREIAQLAGSEITLLNVINVRFPIVAAGPIGENANHVNELYDEAQRDSEKVLQRAKKMFADLPNNIETICLQGDAADAIIDYANSKDIDLVIMGSFGLGAILNRLFMGSVTTKVLHHVNKPILIIK